jgi:hypothetical protein
MNQAHIEVAAGQELEHSEGASHISLLVEDCLHHVCSGNEEPILGNEEASSNCHKDTIVSLRNDGKDGVAKIRFCSVGGFGSVSATWGLALMRLQASHLS